MPSPYGVVATGFSAPTLEEIKTEIEDDQHSLIHPSLNVNSNTVIGQLNGIYASKLRECWEAIQVAAGLMDPDNVSDVQLENICKITGTERNAATKSVADNCTVSLDAGTYAAGSLVASVVGVPDARFVNRDEIVAPGGTLTGQVFEAETAGVLQALAGTLTVIAEPVTGWNSITNVDDAIEGTGIESDPALHNRREVEIFQAGSASDASLAAAVSEVEGVLSVRVLSNETDLTNSEGLPPHSQEVIVYGPSADDDEVAQAIWDNKTGGIPQTGTDSGTATDSEGTTHTISFSKVVDADVWLIVDLDVIAADYEGDTAARESIAAWGDANLVIGTDVRYSKILGAASNLLGVQDVTDVKLGFVDPPTLSANLSITRRQIARLDTARITINSTAVDVT